jgi:hypothetical protein
MSLERLPGVSYVWHERDIFTVVYNNGQWGNGVTLPKSGIGSTLWYTENLRKELPNLLEKYNLKRIYDAPCGDMTWMPLVLESTHYEQYIGADIVSTLIQDMRDKFDNDKWSFRVNNICNDRFPDADVWFCRDCLFHLTNENILKALKNFVNSSIPYILTTSHCFDTVGPDNVVFQENQDGLNGDYRLLNLTASPWNFSEPLAKIDDTYEGFSKRYMGLWTRESVAKALNL